MIYLRMHVIAASNIDCMHDLTCKSANRDRLLYGFNFEVNGRLPFGDLAVLILLEVDIFSNCMEIVNSHLL